MANVITVDAGGVQPYEKFRAIRYNVVLSGNYVQVIRGTNTGELLDLTTTVPFGFQADPFWGKAGPIRGYPLQGPGGVGCQILPGADKLHWLLKVYAVGSNNEHAAGAYEASITGDLDFFVEFIGLSGQGQP